LHKVICAIPGLFLRRQEQLPTFIYRNWGVWGRKTAPFTVG